MIGAASCDPSVSRYAIHVSDASFCGTEQIAVVR